MSKIKPFSTEHTFDDPDNAIEFYEEQIGIQLPEEIVDFLYFVADAYPDALYNVQPSITTNYIAIARANDRRSWAFVKADKVAIWVAHSRNADALIALYPGELVAPESPTRSTREFVDVPGDKAATTGPEVAVAFAAAFAAPYTEDDENAAKFS